MYKLIKLTPQGKLDEDYTSPPPSQSVSESELLALTSITSPWIIVSEKDDKVVASSYDFHLTSTADLSRIRFLGKSLKVGDKFEFSESFSIKKGSSTCRFVESGGSSIREMLQSSYKAHPSKVSYYLNKVEVLTIAEVGVRFKGIRLRVNRESKSKSYQSNGLPDRPIIASECVIRVEKSNNPNLFL